MHANNSNDDYNNDNDDYDDAAVDDDDDNDDDDRKWVLTGNNDHDVKRKWNIVYMHEKIFHPKYFSMYEDGFVFIYFIQAQNVAYTVCMHKLLVCVDFSFQFMKYGVIDS